MLIKITKFKKHIFTKGGSAMENKWLGKQYDKCRRGKIKPYNFESRYLYEAYLISFIGINVIPFTVLTCDNCFVFFFF